MRHRWISHAAFRLCVVSLISTSAQAQQGQLAMIVGEVRDATGTSLANATVSVSSASLIGGAQSVTTARTGSYRLSALEPGEYDVTASASGFRPQVKHGVTLLPGATATIDWSLSPEGVQETINVAAKEPPLVDVRTSAASTVIGRSLLDNLPLSRTLSDYVNLVPGVVGFLDIGVVAFGSSVGANPLTVDGASGNEPDFGTPCTTCPMPLGAVPSPTWIQEVQVVTLGSDAQFGEYTGASMNAITRSGSNRLAGGADYWTTRPNWVASNRGSLTPALATRFRPLTILDQWSMTAQLGGPIRLDRVWFFGGVDVYRNVNRPAGFAAVANPPEDAVSTLIEPKWFGKLTAAPASGVRFDTYFARDLSTAKGANASPTVKPEALTGEERRETLWNARLTWAIHDGTLVEARSGAHVGRDTTGPVDPAAIAGPPGHFDSVTGLSVNATNYGDHTMQVVDGSVEATHDVSTTVGRSHQLKAGFEYEHDRVREESGYPGGMAFFDIDGQPSTVTISAPAIDRPNHQREAFFAQDAFRVIDRLTVNAGIRADFYQGGIAGYPTQFSARSLAPRIGVAWDVLTDHTMVVRAHYGRYAEAMNNSFYFFLDPLSSPTSINAQVVGPGQFVEISRIDANNHYTIDPNIRYPYAEEWIGGVERQLPYHLSLTAQYVGRRYGSIVGFDGLMNWTSARRQDPGPDGVLGTPDDGGFMTIYMNPATDGWYAMLTNPAGAYKHYEGVQFIATRRIGKGWEGQASYTWSHTRASFDNNFSSNAGNNDLGTNGVYVNPNRAIYADGRTSADFTHELKAVGTVELPRPGGVRVSAVYRYQTGMPWARRVRFSGPTQFYAIAVEPRGTRQTDAPNVLDIRVEKTFTAARSKVGIYADVFNATNQGIADRVFSISGPNFGTPNAWSSPRILRGGLRVLF